MSQPGRCLSGARCWKTLPKAGLRETPFLDCRRPALPSRMRSVWLRSAGGGSDGVIAKRLDLPYQAGNREGMQKIKRYRTADCVIGGFRYAEKTQAGRKVAGSVLLGLYDADGLLHHVGLLVRDKGKRQAWADRQAREDFWQTELHGQSTRRPEPMVDETLVRVDAGEAEIRCRGFLRSLHRRTVSAWHVHP